MDALKLEPFQKESNTIILDGDDDLLFLSIRRYGQEVTVTWEQRNLEDKSLDIVEIMRFPLQQFKTDFINSMKENAEAYKLEFESYRDL